MAIPDYQSLMLPVLQLAADGETRVPDAAEKLADQLGLSIAEREEMLPSGRQRIFHNRIHWAKFYITRAGLIDSPARGRFVASQAGKALLATNPAGINVDTLKTYPAFAEFYASSTSGAGSRDAASAGAGESIDATTSATPEEQILQNQIMLVPRLPHWVSARVVLAGDAAHAMSPHITAGATLGIEDAALLGHLVGSGNDVPAALDAYQADRIPRYARVADLSAAVEHSSTPQEFARHYAAFSHWMLQSTGQGRV